MDIYGILIVLAVLAVYFVYIRGPKEPTLYDRLGGVYKIGELVDHFSDKLIKNPVVGKDSPNQYLREWSRNKLDRLPGLKFMRTLWLCSLAGGPFMYSPTKPGKCPFSLEVAHNDLQISPAEFDAVAVELENSLNHFKVPEREKQEVLAAFASHKADVTTGYNISKGIAATPLVC